MVTAGENLLPVGLALKRRMGVEISPPTIWRWVRRGVRGSRLRTVKIGKRLFVTERAVDEFIRNQQPEPLADAPALISRSAADEAALRAAGLLN